MTLTRRRFLTVTAAALAAPRGACAASWQGTALGADVSLTIRGPRDTADEGLARARRLLEEVEALFSLYRPDSALCRLNAAGTLARPDPRLLDLLGASDTAHRLTGGRFDPTVQPWWRALALGQDPAAARAAIGWDRVRWSSGAVTLGTGQALTFNGIAQGYATDLVTDALRDLGLGEVLVNIGEYRALGGPWRLGLSDPAQGHMGHVTLTSGAVATSSPAALSLGAEAHILHPDHRPLWSTVSVSAASATLADALSTALCLAPEPLAEEIATRPDVHAIRLIDRQGNLRTVSA